MKENKLLELPEVTLIALSSINIFETIQAMKYSTKKIKFGKCVFISHKKPYFLPKDIEFKQTSKLKNIDDFNYKILFELYKHIETKFVLIIHYDGFVVNPESWKQEFLDYDYIGSPWPDNEFYDIYGNKIRVGNGVSIRSRKLLELPQKLNLSFEYGQGGLNHEDLFICCRYKHFFTENGIKYAPLEIAKYFGHELMIPEIEGIKPFVFHKWNGNNRHFKKFGLNKYKNSFVWRLLRKIKSFGKQILLYIFIKKKI